MLAVNSMPAPGGLDMFNAHVFHRGVLEFSPRFMLDWGTGFGLPHPSPRMGIVSRTR
jgi:hypothetical protein